MDLGLSGRRAAVAAASRGIGRACAQALAGEGARVAICSRDAGEIEAAAAELAEATGAEVVGLTADVATAEGATGFVREAAEALGGLEILVANGGGPPPGRFDDLTDEAFARAFEGTFQSAVRMTREALPHLRAAGYGRILLIGSIAMKLPIPSLMLSNALRAGLAGWVKTLSHELGGEGITVNALLPDRILTDRIRELAGNDEGRLAQMAQEVPLGRIGDPMDVGRLVAFLAGETGAYLTGGFYPVDGGRYPALY